MARLGWQQVALVQAICSVLLIAFFMHHTWRYDRWDCLNLRKLSTSLTTRHTFKRASSPSATIELIPLLLNNPLIAFHQ